MITPGNILPSWLRRSDPSGAPSKAFIMLAAFVIGVICGAAAQFLRFCVDSISTLAKYDLDPSRWNWRFLWLPVAGIILAAFYQRHIIHTELYHGVERMKDALLARHPFLSLKLTFSPIIAAALTLGMGGSAGTEGPIAYASGAVGSNVARRCRFSPDLAAIFTAIGAGAGIAAIFRAPIGGFFFTIEVMGLAMGLPYIIALGVCTLTAGVTAWMLAGGQPDIQFPAWSHFNLSTIPVIVIAGVFCGLYSAYYNKVMRFLTRTYEHLPHHWYKNLAAGLVIGLALFLLPSLYGEGYGVIASVLKGDLSALTAYGPLASFTSTAWGAVGVCALLLLIKAIATASTTSGGGVAGDFAPAIFAGCAAGLLFATTANLLFNLNLPPANYAYFGMAAVLGGTSKAPLMASFLVVEMSGHYSLLMPVAATTAISYLIVIILGYYPQKRSVINS